MTAPLRSAVLALDVGTSSCRASLYDLQGRPVAGRASRIPYTPHVTPDGGGELDPHLLLDQVCAAIERVLTQDPLEEIVAVATDTFWHSLIGVDDAGEPVTPVFLWLDARSRGEVAGLRQRLDEHAVHARTGCVLHWTYWPAKLTWLRRTRPHVFKRAQRWMSFGELLLEQLTGEPRLSLSMASGTGLLDVHSGDWDAEVLDVVGIDRERLGRIVPLKEAATTRRWPALSGVPWLPAVGDGACSNLGAGCASADRFAVMIGTSGAERVVWSPPDPFEVPWGAWCYRIDRRRVVLGGALNDGGSLMEWLRGALHLPALAVAEEEVAAMEPDSHGLTVLPFWAGERSPGWADDARGAIVGLRLHSQPVEIQRACMEAVALRFGEVDQILLQAMPNAREVVATGGALLHSPTWMQILADVLDRPVLASAEPEASSRGASLLALETLGLLELPMEELQPDVTRRFEPRPEHTRRYRAAAERQRHVYDALVFS
ncbi:MAG: carbohydrate kinase [Chloroflexi bacterium]|nr:MAG: carbohydrate kinase [Chloroflexota bacterium]